ncbi:MAG: MlaE family lipid ABC transporter permease subunit [Roseobacter sp.]
MTQPTVTIETSGKELHLRFAGDMRMHALDAIETPMGAIPVSRGPARLDLSAIEALDTGGAWMLCDLQRRLEDQGAKVTLIGATKERFDMLKSVAAHRSPEPIAEDPAHGVLPGLEALGAATVRAARNTAQILSFFGLTLHRLTRALLMPWRLRWASLFTQMDEAGLKAVPIVALMGFLIGVVLAFQGAAQLQQFGAEVFVVELISISILRELGVLLTAIIIAGRSGSAFTASIGSMKVQEEIDAMRTLGLDPMDVLVVPRTLALLIMLPILTMTANLSGLIGGALMSWIDLGVSPSMFITRLQENTGVWNLAIGLIKAPFFAVIIAVVACYQAMQVKGSAQSVGARTTAAVVQSIFAVIVMDALFSIYFSEMAV